MKKTLALEPGQCLPHAAVRADREADLPARVRPVDPELVGPVEHGRVAVGGEQRQHDRVARGDALAAQHDVGQRHPADRRTYYSRGFTLGYRQCPSVAALGRCAAT